MRPLTFDDLLPLPEFAARRREIFAAQRFYRDAYRRVRLGPKLTVQFENRQTLWFRVQEVLHIARLADPKLVQAELDCFNRLLPGKNHLHASLLIALDETRWEEETRFWQGLGDGSISLVVGEFVVPAKLLTSRPEDRAAGAAHWLEFALGDDARLSLANLRSAARLEIKHPGYEHVSAFLDDEMRKSLLDDLVLSDRAAA